MMGVQHALVLVGVAFLSCVGDASSGQRKCPQPTAHFSSQAMPEYTEVVATFVNRVGVQVSIEWVNYENEEMEGTRVFVNHGESVQQTTFSGHAWRVYSVFQTPKVLISEHIIGLEDLTESEVTIVIKYCSDVEIPGAPELPTEWVIPNEPQAPDEVTSKASLAASCDLSLLSEVAEPGCHTVCLLPLTDEEKSVVANTAVKRLVVFFNNEDSEAASHSFLLPSSISTVPDFTDFVETQLAIVQRSLRKSGVFKMNGTKLREMDFVKNERTVMLFEGGQWVWPGVRIGHQYEFGHMTYDDKVTVMETLSFKPKVFEIKTFLKPSENEHVIERARPHLSDADVATKDSDVGRETSEWRISKYYFMSSMGDPKLQNIEKRVEQLTHVPLVNFEDPQVLRYDQKGFYSAHHDFFDPSAYVNNPGMSQMVAGGKNRLATVFFYLSNVTKGGETAFPRAGGLPQPYDFKDCSKGFSVKPLAGKVILFYSLLPSGELDELSLHGGCKVKEGEKWSVNFWLWNSPQSGRLSRMVGQNMDYLRDEL